MVAVYRYRFADQVDFDHILAALDNAVSSVESLHGPAAVRMDARHTHNRDDRLVAIDASSRLGEDLNKLFAGLLLRDLREDSFSLDRMTGNVVTTAEAA